MRPYLNKPMQDLATDLSAGLRRLRKGYVDAAEALLRIVDPAQQYPYEFVVYKLTGYRSRPAEPGALLLAGKSLQQDLLGLMLDVCESFDFRTEDYQEPVYDVQSLARRLRISTKTLHRWRRMGLPARKLVFPDGKCRLAFLQSSLRWFVHSRRRKVMRSIRFSHVQARERQDIIRRARRMAQFSRSTLASIAKRIAARLGRSPETVRYIIRRHDVEHPEQAVFPHTTPPVDDQTKSVIYQCFLRGVSAHSLAERYGRTRGSIYRIINEMRAKALAKRPIDYIYNPQFDLPNADALILAPLAAEEAPAAKPATGVENAARPAAELTPELLGIYGVPLLTPSRERDLFRAYNYIKCKADRLRRQIDANRIRASHLKQIEMLLLQASVIKNEIVRANMRLVVSIARRHMRTQGLAELMSDGNVALLKAVEKFDYSRGNRFSTYASWAVMRNFARSVPRERYQLDRFATGYESLESAAAMAAYDGGRINLPELRESVDALLAQLSPRERTVLIDHYGLDQSRPPQTLEAVGKAMGLSKERVRQIEIRALHKLRSIARPHGSPLER